MKSNIVAEVSIWKRVWIRLRHNEYLIPLPWFIVTKHSTKTILNRTHTNQVYKTWNDSRYKMWISTEVESFFTFHYNVNLEFVKVNICVSLSLSTRKATTCNQLNYQKKMDRSTTKIKRTSSFITFTGNWLRKWNITKVVQFPLLYKQLHSVNQHGRN